MSPVTVNVLVKGSYNSALSSGLSSLSNVTKALPFMSRIAVAGIAASKGIGVNGSAGPVRLKTPVSGS
jgi:hypothetical protein